jgi:hypothetical protein
MDNDELAAEPPETFIAARDALVKELKAAGDKAGAAAVKALRKPTVAQWMTSEVERRYPDVVEKVRATSREVAAAQEAAITKGNRDGLKDAIDHRRAALVDLERAVDASFAVTGRSVQHRDEVFAAVEAAATAAAAPGTFGIRDDLELPELPKRAPAKPKPDPEAERRAKEAAEAVARAEKRVEDARRELAAAEAALDKARAGRL